MQIKEVVSATGLSVDTIRYYEKQGLLDDQHIRRRENNYREYLAGTVERLELIAQAQAAGFTLAEIRASIQDWEGESLSSEEKRVLFEQKIAQIEQQIEQLEKIKTYLNRKLDSLLAL